MTVSSERRAAAALLISCWQLAIASQESGALVLLGYLVVTTLCASIAFARSCAGRPRIASQNWALGANELSGFFLHEGEKAQAASLYFCALNWFKAAS